jgi:hypothetical protein
LKRFGAGGARLSQYGGAEVQVFDLD